MAHFAQLDANNIVTQVIVVNNNVIKDSSGTEHEDLGIAFCKELFGADTNWKQTSYNATFRRKFAAVGEFYNAEADAFMEPKPYPSWTLNTNPIRWDPPVPEPQDLNIYDWDEQNQNWVFKEKSFLAIVSGQ